ncbi:MAG: alanine--tRNA ligase [Longimicrobiales bacterium]
MQRDGNMTSSEVRQTFIDYFARHGHEPRPSSSLVPGDDPTLLFTNAGMVQFKRAFLGEERLPYRRAVTSQKCLRVSGKHNDLEEVGVTARHHTFFEMLGNFSFGDYFKRDAIGFAWELMTEEYGLDPDRLWATVHHTDDEAAKLWEDVAGLSPQRIFRLGDKDNFWQMGETGPCGPCSELHYDLRSDGGAGMDVTVEEFERLGSAGRFLELWNLVFMQFDRAADGTMTPLPAPSIDTGAGLERVTAVLQGVESNYRTDLFVPLIDRGVEVVGIPYVYESAEGVSYRVLADHARSVSFLLADGVIPSNEGRGYVLRRILRRAVRHAWLLGRREPTLVHVADRLVDTMGEMYPQLREQRSAILEAVRAEEQRFLDTIDSGMARLAELAPPLGASQQAAIERAEQAAPIIPGEDAFRLHDTFGFPLDLTELIARERGYRVAVEGFESALETQRERSRQDRRATAGTADELPGPEWQEPDGNREQEWVGYEELDVATDVIGYRQDSERAALILQRNPFYVEAGGQIDDMGIVEGEGWTVEVDDVRRAAGRTAVVGRLRGVLSDRMPLPARARVDRQLRKDTQRNHTATHLLHAALREQLGTHVSQKGSLVAPDRLRFDFSHPRPLATGEIRTIEERVNEAILADHGVATTQMAYAAAVSEGAMALFGEKYGDVVRVVRIPGVSIELCGGCHVRTTSDIGQFRILSETGVAAGVRRIEAITGSRAYRYALKQDALLSETAALLRTTPESLPRRFEQLIEENRELRKQLERARDSGGRDQVAELLEHATAIDGMRIVTAEIDTPDPETLRALGDRLRERLGSGAAVLAGRSESRVALIAVVTDDLPGRGVRADRLVREVAALTGGSGGGRQHMAQGGVGDAAKVPEALARTPEIIRSLAGA